MRSVLLLLPLLALFQVSFATKQCFYQKRIEPNFLMGFSGIWQLLKGELALDEAGVEMCHSGVNYCYTRQWGNNIMRGCHYKGDQCKEVKKGDLTVSCCQGELCNAPIIHRRKEFQKKSGDDGERTMKLKLPNQAMEIEVPIIKEYYH